VLIGLKLPSDEILDLIDVEKTLLLKKISGLGSDDKKRIESIVDNVLVTKDIEDVGYLNSINRILYFIDVSFIKMIAPKFIEEILAY